MNYEDWLNVSNPWAVVEAAARSDVARDAAVKRIIDTMLELQLDMRHENIGYQPFSVASMAGEVMGGGGRSDQAMIAAMRYHPESAWHRACAALPLPSASTGRRRPPPATREDAGTLES